MSLALLLTLNLLFAGTPVFFKIAGTELSVVTFVWIRHTLAFLWVLPLALTVGIPRLTPPEILRVGFAALSAFTGASLLQATAMQHADASAGAILVAMEPVLMFLFALLFLHERFRTLLGVGFALACAGFVVLSWGEGITRIESNMLYLIAVLLEAIYPALIVPLLRHRHPAQVAFYCLLSASLALLPFQSSDALARVAHLSNAAWGALLYLGIGCSGTAAVLWLYAMRRMQSATVAISWFLQPVWGSVLAVWILGETLSLQVYCGGALILGAVSLLCRVQVRSTRHVAQLSSTAVTIPFPASPTHRPSYLPSPRMAFAAFHHPPRRHRPQHRNAA